MNLPDVDGWRSPRKGARGIMVYAETDTQTSAEVLPKDDEVETQAISPCPEDVKLSEAPDITEAPQKVLSRFSYTPNAVGNPSARASRSNSSIPSPSEETPASSASSERSRLSTFSCSQASASTARTTPSTTPRLTPLQRLGARALNRGKQPQPAAPSAPAPPRRNRPNKSRPSLEAMPLNPAFVPLPHVDVDEVEALHRPSGGGSEDMLHPPESEDEDEHEGGDASVAALGRRPDASRAGKKVDLSRFLFN